MEQILTYFLSITALTGAAVWFGKLLINKAFDFSIEKYKSSLQKDMEAFKSQLSKMALEHQIKFSKLHEDRAEKIKILYTQIVNLEQSLIDSTWIAQGPEYMHALHLDKKCQDNLRELNFTLNLNKIYFSDTTIKKFESIFSEAWEIINRMRQARSSGIAANEYIQSGQLVPEIYLKDDHLWIDAHKKTANEFKILKEDLENEFRILLGIQTLTQ